MNLANRKVKTMILIVIVLMLLMITGCSKGKTDNNGGGKDPVIDNPPVKRVFVNMITTTKELIAKELVEFSITEVDSGYIEEHYNPYDYNQINVYANITNPSGKTIKVYGFWYRDYQISLNTGYTGGITGISGTPSKDPNEPQGLEQVKWLTDDYEFRFRFTPEEAGKHTIKICVEEKGEQVQQINGELDILENPSSNNRGIMQIDPTNNRHFIDGNGKTFIPIGSNLCWWTNGNRKTYDYDVWFSKLNANSGNLARIWMATWGFCQHWNGKIDNFNSSQNMAARLDRVMNLADQYNIYLQLCLVNHGQFSTVANSEWNKNPYNTANGGMLSSPANFFKDDVAKETYKLELRYIIARYGYSDKLFAWELFNEVDWTDAAENYNQFFVKTWHQDMAKFVKENDPYNHLITTSYKYFNSSWNLAFGLDEIDFASVHSYGFNDKNVNVSLPAEAMPVINKYDKPVHVGEMGINWESGYASKNLDPTGISIRQGLWSGMMGGTAGGAMQWWWDSWIHPNNLYYLYQGAGKFAEKLNLSGTDYTLLNSNNVSINNSKGGILGYQFADRIYGYSFNKDWTYYKGTPQDIVNLSLGFTLNDGTYTLTIYNTLTGAQVKTQTVNCIGGKINITLPTFNEDIAFIIE